MKNGKWVLAHFVFAVIALGASVAQGQALSREEKLIRITYAKAMLYSKAGSIRRDADNLTAHNPQNDLRFSIWDARTGPIEEILDRPLVELVTKPSGQVIEMIPAVHTLNGEDPRITYRARWTPVRYSSVEDWENTSIRQLLEILGNAFSDIGMYTSYEVTVRFEGRERTYRAMALYHNQFQSTAQSRVEFLDNIIGYNILTRTFLEKRPPVRAGHPRRGQGGQQASASTFGPGEICDDGGIPGMCCDSITMMCCFSYNPSNGICDQMTCEYPSCNDPTPGGGGGGGDPGCLPQEVYGQSNIRFASGTLYHQSGRHTVQSSLQGHCAYFSDCSSRCRVNVEYVRPSDTGFVWSACHVPGDAVKYNDSDGASGQSISCSTTVAVAYEACLFCLCQVEVTIGPGGIQSSGFWNYEHTHNHLCPPLSQAGAN